MMAASGALRAYYTLLVPWVPLEFATEWHCKDTKGQWAYATLTRGSYPTVSDAIAWGKAKLNGTPYSVSLCADVGCAVTVVPSSGDAHSGLHVVLGVHEDGRRDLWAVCTGLSLPMSEAQLSYIVECAKPDVTLSLARLLPTE